MSEPTLHASLCSLAGGNMDALDAIYRLTCKKVYAVALSVTHNRYDAEDVMQDTYAKLCDSVAKYTRGDNPEAWVCMIARNVAYDLLRKQKNDLPLDESVYTIPAESEDATVQDAYHALMPILERCLSAEEREILLLHTVGGMKHTQIAKAVGKPYATVRWVYANALKKVKKEVEGRRGVNEAQ